MNRPELPEPTADALAVSAALLDLIVREIGRLGGWMPFSRYMEMALYQPLLGYYAGGAAKLGREGDFTTAPEITPLFGAALAHAAAPLLAQTKPQILEFGAGSGKLAFDLLTELADMGVAVERYAILEVSGELRARQQEKLRDFPQVEWLDALPEAFSGVVLANEVLDAMPVQLVVRTEAGWRERGVVADGERLAFAERECGPALLAQIASQIPDADALPAGYVTEVHARAEAFMRTLSSMLAAGEGGAAILIDYGFPAHEYYLPERSQGTLMCHYRRRAHADPFHLPGLQDITAHIDFSLAARAAVESGLELLCYASQAAFLMAAGIGELLLRTPPEDAARYLPQAQAANVLLAPTEMGELFKALVIGKNVGLPPQFVRFARFDRSDRL